LSRIGVSHVPTFSTAPLRCTNALSALGTDPCPDVPVATSARARAIFPPCDIDGHHAAVLDGCAAALRYRELGLMSSKCCPTMKLIPTPAGSASSPDSARKITSRSSAAPVRFNSSRSEHRGEMRLIVRRPAPPNISVFKDCPKRIHWPLLPLQPERICVRQDEQRTLAAVTLQPRDKVGALRIERESLRRNPARLECFP